MIIPQIPQNEKERLNALLAYQILDSDPEKDFDDIVALASEICNTPMSTITLIDKNRQWFKSKIGLEFEEGSRENSFCAHAINSPGETLIVSDTLKDVRFSDNPLVTDFPNIRSYAGVPLVDIDGFALGSLCVVDTEPRHLSPFQISALEKLANQVIKLLELRKKNIQLSESYNSLLTKYKDLEQFASIVSHDLKSPLNNIILLSKLLQESNKELMDAESIQMLDYIRSSSVELKKLVDAILSYYKYDNENVAVTEIIRLNDLLKYIIGILDIKNEFKFILPKKNHKLYSNKIALVQILFNIISNSIKYNDKPKGIITIDFSETDDFYILSLTDNGIGIDKENFDKIFNIFETLGKTDRFDLKGTGMGLSTVQKMVEKLNGKIEIESEIGQGTTFTIFLKK